MQYDGDSGEEIAEMMEEVEIMEDNAVIMEASGHMCRVVMRWAKAREGSQPYKEDEGNKAKQSGI